MTGFNQQAETHGAEEETVSFLSYQSQVLKNLAIWF
jgi:hypothetical protein